MHESRNQQQGSVGEGGSSAHRPRASHDKFKISSVESTSVLLRTGERATMLPKNSLMMKSASVKHSPAIKGAKDSLTGFDDKQFQTAKDFREVDEARVSESVLTPNGRTNRNSFAGDHTAQKGAVAMESSLPTTTHPKDGNQSHSQTTRRDAGYRTFTDLFHLNSKRGHHTKTSSMHSAVTLDIQEFYLSKVSNNAASRHRKTATNYDLFGRKRKPQEPLLPSGSLVANPEPYEEESSFPKSLARLSKPDEAWNKPARSSRNFIEDSYKVFEELHSREVSNSILLEFPTDVREYLDTQGAKMKHKTKSLLVEFEKGLFAFNQISDSVKAYKPELGASCLEIMSDCRKSWKDAVVYLCRQCVHVQEIEKEARQKILSVQVEEQKQVRSMELKVKSLETMLAYRDSEIDRLQTSIKVKQSEIEDLYESKKIFQQIIRHNDPDQAASERMESLHKLSALQDRITQLSKDYKKIEEERLTQMKNIDLLKELTNRNFFTHHKDAEVQVDEYELQWGLKSLKRETNMNPEFSHLNDRISSLVAHPLSTFEDPMKYVASSSHTKSDLGSGTGHRDTIVTRDLGSQVNFGSVTTFDNPASGQNSPTADRKGSVLKKKTSPVKPKHGKVAAASAGTVQPIVWQLPFGICRFLEDIYGHYTDVSVVVWHTFKTEIFQLLEARLSDDWEVIGSPTNAVVPFEEYIILYFIRKTPQLRLAALKLMEFLASLKFYADKWKRAYICALVCNLMRRKDSGIYDYYLQNYVLFLYSRFGQLRDLFVETEEGYTFVPFDKLHDFLNVALEFMETDRCAREISGIEMRARTVEGKEGMIDVDDVLYQCVSLFLEEYTKRTDYLKKSFRSHYQKRGKDITFVDFDRIITENGWFTLSTGLKHLTFAGELTRSRAYNLFCNLYSDKKKHIDECFEISIKRYGLSIPFPLFISDVFAKIQADKKGNTASGSIGVTSKASLQPSSPKTGKSSSKDKGFRAGGPMGKRVQLLGGTEDDDKRDKAGANSQDLRIETRPRLGSTNLASLLPVSPPGLQISSTVTLTPPVQTKPLSLIPHEPSNVSGQTASKQHGSRRLDPDVEEKVALSSSLIAQHFSILRELYQYCMLVKSNVGPDSSCMNLEEIWRNFNHLVEILEAGCDFLHYPIKMS